MVQDNDAEVANRAKGQFLTTMSHELRTPMNAILGMIDVALPRITDPTVQDCLQTARGAAAMLSACLNDLLDSASVELGRGEPGEESRFCLTVPLPVAQRLPADNEAQAVVSATARASLHVLLVDDNPANQKLAAYFLQDRGHCVEVAGDGREAVFLTGENRYDAVLMDVQMPEMDGLEATATIRQRENGGSRVPIIAMTAHALKGDREQCLAAGMDAFISKPINRNMLIEVVERLAQSAAAMPARCDHRERHNGKAHDGAQERCDKRAGPEEQSPLSLSVSPSGPVPGNEPFNFDAALASLGGEMAIFREMAGFFFRDGLNLLAEIPAAAVAGQATVVEKKAHRLKGTVLYLGAGAAVKAIARVEALARSGDLSGIVPAIRAMEAEVMRLAEALRQQGP
jgi:two-component system sensor histidine kinase/response regulator